MKSEKLSRTAYSDQQVGQYSLLSFNYPNRLAHSSFSHTSGFQERDSERETRRDGVRKAGHFTRRVFCLIISVS